MKISYTLNFKRIVTTMLIWDGRIWLWNRNLSTVTVTKITIAQNWKMERKKHKEDAKADVKTAAASEEDEEPPVPLVTHVNNILHSIVTMLKFSWKINIYTIQVDSMSTSPTIPKTSRRQSLSTWEFCIARGTIWTISGQIYGIVFAWTFFHKENEIAQRTRWLFLLLVKLGVDFSSNFQLLNPIMKLKLRQFRAGPNFYIFSDNRNVSLGIVGCSLYTRRIALKHDYHKNWLNMLAYTLVDFEFFTNWRL